MTRARDIADRNFADNDKIVLGNGDDLEISHNATNSIIENKTGYLALRSQDGGQIRIEDASGNANALFNDNSDVKLRFNASDRLVTTSAGVDITGGFTATDGCTITTADNDAQLSLVSTDADANFGPKVSLYRNSSSPADDDFLGIVEFDGENDAGKPLHMLSFLEEHMM